MSGDQPSHRLNCLSPDRGNTHTVDRVHAVAEAEYMRRTRDGYDLTAGAYAERFHQHLRDKPLDRAIIGGFAGLVSQTGNLPIADVGCGTGATTAMFGEFGVDVIGIDLSPNMIAEARRRNPSLTFHVGSMTDLPFDDNRFGGLCAWYSIIHVPDDALPQVFSELRRVLRPDGLVLLAFQVGDQPRYLTEVFGQRVELTFHRRRPDAVAALLEQAGLTLYATFVRQPDDDGLESTPQAYVIAQSGTVT
jgi:ubiquinone/menaquinone biosynthesis C-methylase UbiE